MDIMIARLYNIYIHLWELDEKLSAPKRTITGTRAKTIDLFSKLNVFYIKNIIM